MKLEYALSQPEGWAAVETVALIGPKGTFKNVRVVGPTRTATQIEVSRTDTSRWVLMRPGAIRAAWSTPKVQLRGLAGELTASGLIVDARHIHLHTTDAKELGLQDGSYVDLKVNQGERAISFANTRVRVEDHYVTEMHIDTDEANAAGITSRPTGELMHQTMASLEDSAG